MREKYIAPSIEVIKMDVEGSIMALSAVGPATPGIKSSSRRSSSIRSGSSAGLNELEDMISDILQYEK